MNLYFKNSQGVMREIAQISDDLTTSKARAEAIRHIHRFCNERNFKIYYIRIWNTEQDNKPMTKFDVGSHTEFFYTDRIVFNTDNTVKEVIT